MPFAKQLPLPVASNSFSQERKRDVIRTASAAAEFAHHAHRAVGVACVNEDGGGALEFGVGAEPRCDGVTSAFVVS